MIEQAENFFKKYDLLHPEKTYLVGFSGGFDSGCMLDIMHKLSKKCGFKIIALHLNHNWRAQESDFEQKRCEEFCKERKIPIIAKKLNENTPKTETCAREARIEFFSEKYKEFSADGLFLAHTKSDNAETIVYRMARGTGMRGLCGIFEHNCINGMKIYRPLLNFSRNEIENYCKAENLSPNNDSSNENTKYKRNFIRKNIIPLLKELNPDAESALASLSSTAESEQNIISEYLGKIRSNIVKNGKINAEKYFSLSKDVKKRILLDLLLDLGLDYDSGRVLGIYEFVEKNSASKSGKTCSLARDLWLFVSQKEIYTFSKREKCEKEVEISGEGKYFLNGFEFFVKKFDFGNNVPARLQNAREMADITNLKPLSGQQEHCSGNFRQKAGKMQEIPLNFPDEHSDFIYCSNLDFPLMLRYRKNGDRIRPFGMKGTMKLKKMFINKNIPKNERESVILLCKNNEILWAHGVCVSEKLRVTDFPEYVLEIRKGGSDGQEN